jgi:hypothetical protein
MGILLGDSILNPLKEVHKKKHFADLDPNDEKTRKELENLKIDPDQVTNFPYTDPSSPLKTKL